MKKEIQENRIKELDALRGIAALMVVLFHFTMGRPAANLGFKYGTTGVDLFFIISGFVIFMTLTKVKGSLDFVINRVSRLYPAYWVCVTFTFLLISAIAIYKNHGVSNIDFGRYFGNLTMFQFYLGVPDLDGPYWTMIIEMIFYVLMLLLFHFNRLNYLNAVGIGLSVLTALAAVFFSEVNFVEEAIVWLPFLQFCPLFFAGTIFYRIHALKRRTIGNYSILVVSLVCQILLFKSAGKSFKFISQGEYAMILLIYFGLFTLFVNNKLAFLVSRGTLFLGKISFSLYLIHQFISVEVIIPFLVNKLHVNFWIASFVICLPIVILLATAVTYFFETPLSRRMKERLRRLKAQMNLESYGHR